MSRLALALVIGVFLVLPELGAEAQRGILWRAVQACLVDHDLTGAPFPCLSVQTKDGLESGYVVLRAPFVKSHAIVAPTVPTIGIEAPRLRGTDAPNYFADAWASRAYATQGLARQPGRADLALAVNSRTGRSQDQLHIHVDCIRPKVKARLAEDAGHIVPGQWTRLRVLPFSPLYWATAVPGDSLTGVNVFDLVAGGLHVTPEDMHDITIVVVGADDVVGKPGFIVLARKRVANSRDEAHGEALMDHSCPAFRSNG